MDLFFLLSGFVVAFAYDSKFRRGWHAIEFLKIRLIRLYPLYLLALLIGTMKMVAQFWVGESPPRVIDLAADVLLEFFFLPNPTTIGKTFDTTFPINPVAWSLFFELLMNVVYAMAFRWLFKTRNLVLIVIVSGAVLCAVIDMHGSDQIGNVWRTFGSGFPRAAFPFFLGVLLSRVEMSGRKLGDLWGIVIPFTLVCVLSLTTFLPRVIWDAVCVFIIFPILVLAGAAVQPTGILRRISLFAGAISYGLYTMNLPTIGLVDAFLRHTGAKWHLWIGAGPCFVAAMVVVCWLADTYYDNPVRSWLKSRNTPKSAAVLGTDQV